jgi:hypothetical protein
MNLAAADFVFKPAPAIARARRILIKPCAAYPLPHPVTTSRQTLEVVINGIRRVSDADIILLEGTPTGAPMQPIYRALGYDFPRVLMLDVKDCIWVEVENPLLHALAVPTFWVPNVVLSSDYLISIAPFKVMKPIPYFTITNLIGLLPISKYRGSAAGGWEALHLLGMEKVLSDLYFTLPFDLGIIDARYKFSSTNSPTEGESEPYGRVFIGEPYDVDREAARAAGVQAEYLDMIDAGRVELES